jgi:hypothetical protein
MPDEQTLPVLCYKLKTVIIDTTLMQALNLCLSAAKLLHSSEAPLKTAERAFLERAQACIAANEFPALERIFRSDLPRPGFLAYHCLIRKTTKCIPFAVKGDLRGDGSSPRNLHMCHYQNPDSEEIESYREPWQVRNMPASLV